MTTVGFGDKVTITPYGKTFTVIWMLISTWVMSFFVAGLSSTMTVEKMNDVIDNIQDLKVTKVASIVGTTSGMFLEENNIRFIMYQDVKEALDAITNHELETFVYDTPILKYYMKDTKYENIVLSNKKYEPQYYGFGLTKNFKYESELNSLILKFINSDEWNNNLRKYNLNE
jgi:ABC-type amino acid transport substrate-binding protein